MTYSLVGAPAIGFDLARLDGGPRVAAIMRTALACGPTDLERLAVGHPGAAVRDGWRQAWSLPGGPQRARRTLALAGEALDRAGLGDVELLRRLERSLLGDLEGLDRLLRREVLDWTWVRSTVLAVQDPIASTAADVLVDAAASAWLEDTLDPGARRAMATGFVRSGLVVRDGLAPTGVPAIDEHLCRLAAADHGTRAAWRETVDRLRVRTAQWAPAMHRASWALSVAQRVRLAADAQLATVIAFRQAGFSARDAAYGVWNAVSGVVHAGAALDLLPAADADVLLRPWRLVHGDEAC